MTSVTKVLGTFALADALGAGVAKQLRQLDLSRNSFGEAGARALSRALLTGSAPNLRLLDLSYNDLGEAGARALAEIVSAAQSHQLVQLEELNLGFTHLGDAGIRIVTDALCTEGSTPNLRQVFLMGNRIISDAGARCIAKVGHKRPGLRIMS